MIRYRAIVGLRLQNHAEIMPYSNSILKVMNDPYPPAAVATSPIAYQEFGERTAKENLKRMFADYTMDVALISIHHLRYVKNKNPFIETVKTVHEMKSSN